MDVVAMHKPHIKQKDYNLYYFNILITPFIHLDFILVLKHL